MWRYQELNLRFQDTRPYVYVRQEKPKHNPEQFIALSYAWGHPLDPAGPPQTTQKAPCIHLGPTLIHPGPTCIHPGPMCSSQSWEPRSEQVRPGRDVQERTSMCMELPRHPCLLVQLLFVCLLSSYTTLYPLCLFSPKPPQNKYVAEWIHLKELELCQSPEALPHALSQALLPPSPVTCVETIPLHLFIIVSPECAFLDLIT